VDVAVKKLEEYGYGKVIGLVVYKAVKLHSSITLREVLKVLEDGGSRFKQYNVEESWCSYPVLKVRLLKG